MSPSEARRGAPLYYLRTLGEVALHRGGPEGEVCVGQSRTLALVAWLSITPEHRARREYLAALLWPRTPRAQRLRSLRQALYYLARRGAPDLLDADDESVRLPEGALETDVARFEDLVRRQRYADACALYRGRFLEPLQSSLEGEIVHWIEARAERLRIAHRVATTKGVERALERGEAETAVELARRHALHEPLDETAQQLLVRSLVRAGRKAEALMAYEEYATILAEACEDRPREELAEMAGRVRAELLAPIAAPPAAPPEPAAAQSSDPTSVAAPETPSESPPEPSPEPPEPPPEPPEAAEPSDPLRRARRAPREAVAWLAGSIVLIGGLSLALADGGRGAADRSPELGRLVLRAGLEGGWRHVTVRGDRLEDAGPVPFPRWLDEWSIPLPSGEGVAVGVPTPDGYDVRFRAFPEDGSGEDDPRTRLVAGARAEERPLDWSPDGRWLLYTAGRVTGEGRGYVWEARAWDRVTGRHRRLAVYPEAPNLSGRWSPDGRWVALASGTWLELVSPDGAARRRLAEEPGLGPAVWSPDGTRLAYHVRREGRQVLEVRPIDGGPPRTIAEAEGEFVDCRWMAENRILVIHRQDRAHRLEWVAPATGERGRIEGGEGYAGFKWGWSRPAERRWVRAVHLSRPDSAPVGLALRLRAEAEWSDGARAALEPERLRWRTLPPDAPARLPESGLLVLDAAEAVTVEASLGGWRADTLTLRGVPLVARRAEPAFVEDWTAGLDTAAWALRGRPQPSTRRAGGPEGGGVFVGNGDRNHASGALTRRGFDASEGLTVEVWGRMPFTGRHYEDFGIGIAPPPGPRSDPRPVGNPFPRLFLQFRVVGGRHTAALSGRWGETPVSWPDEPGAWHLYTLQLAPNGDVLLLVDGEPWRSAPGLLAPGVFEGPLSVALLGMSSAYDDVDVEHGTLRVYEGVRYRPAEGRGQEGEG